VILATWEAEIRTAVQMANSSRDPNSKITRAKWTGGVAQVVEHLLCKSKARNSKPSATKKKKKEMGPSGRKLDPWGLALEGAVVTLTPPLLSLCFPAIMR
jgi:hypothetical protein